MRSFKSYAMALGMLAVSASSTAWAADLLPPPPMPEPVGDFGGNWYLRGDVGVGLLQFDKTVARDASSPSVPYNYVKHQDTISDQVFVGVGVGYQFSSWLRFDVTGEYRTKSDWRFIAQDTTFGSPNAFDLTSGKFSTVVGLANVYFDLGTWYGVTPFIGGGVGVANHMFETVTDEGLGANVGGFGTGRSRDKTNLAWALHAGLGYEVSQNLKLELAYRYLNMGDAEVGTVTCIPGCALRTNYKLKEIDSHDIKIGMRWALGGPVASYEPPPPLIRKY